MAAAVTRGLTYPLTLSNGGLSTSIDINLIKEGICSVLETRPLERIMRPRYGTPDLAFQAHPNPSIVAERVRQQLELQLPSVTFQVAGTVDEDGVYELTIDWAIGELPQPAIQYRLVV